MAYTPVVLIVSAGKEANSHAWMVQGIRRLFFIWLARVRVRPVVVVLSQSRWSHCLTTGVNSLGRESVGWTIRKVAHPTGLNRLVENPQAERSTIHRFFF